MIESRTLPLRPSTAVLEFGQILEERLETNWDVFINWRLLFGRFSARLKRPETRRNKRTSPLKSLGRIIHTGSSPVPGTIKRKVSKSRWLLAFFILFLSVLYEFPSANKAILKQTFEAKVLLRFPTISFSSTATDESVFEWNKTPADF